MKIIDLSQKLFDGMPVYPGDPEVEIKRVHTFENEGWNLCTIFITTHIGTHVNVPLHMMKDGKNLDDYDLESFIGECVLYESAEDIKPEVGIVFHKNNIDEGLMQKIIEIKPKFVGLSEDFDFDLDIERKLLEKGIISYENLTNIDKLPKQFYFYGVPLNIREADGSPVRAFAKFE